MRRFQCCASISSLHADHRLHLLVMAVSVDMPHDAIMTRAKDIYE
ncbi:MAG: hypothetical protein ABIN69_08690 [Aestuariivirga sp.]